MAPVRLGVLVSGTGTILEAIFEHGIDVALVAADRDCRGLEIARQHGVEAVLVDRAAFGGFSKSFDREGYTTTLSQLLTARSLELVAMSGFGTIATNTLHQALPDRILNTHPSLLPLHKGWHAVRLALQDGSRESGCTVHVATLTLDEGPILAQRSVPILADDSEESLHERIKNVERDLYPLVIEAAIVALEKGRPLRSVRVP